MTHVPLVVRRRPRRLWSLIAAALLTPCILGPAFAADRADDDRRAERRWQERLAAADRAVLEENVGHAPPPLAEDLAWIGSDRLSWSDLRGQVVVVQSWNSRTPAGRKVPDRLTRLLRRQDAKDVRFLLLHTPEGAEDIQAFLERRPPSAPIVVDARGALCDALGVYRRPVNIVIDRQGAVRYAGLNARGLREVVALLVAEPFDPGAPAPAPRPMVSPETPPSAAFPAPSGPVSYARDLRGQPAPEFRVSKWVTPSPAAEGRVVVLDFWATWCKPCVAAIPHMNELADRFGDRVAFIGLSDETPGRFDSGLTRLRLDENDFHYALALDQEARMKSAFAITGIPHCVVISGDWVVRWQGNPMRLDASTLEAIVTANAGATSRPAPSRRRWTSP